VYCYCALNNITIKNNHPLPRIDDLLDWLNGAKYFSQIDLKSRYYQIHIADENVEKMAMKTMYNLYEFLVIQFGLCNAPLTFTTFMNSILDEFMIIYINDILVYWNIIKEHVEHFGYVLNKFRQNNFLLIRWKMSFIKRRWIS